MEVPSSEFRPVSLERRFPILRLLRSVGIALEARKLILAALGMIVSWAGLYAIDGAFGPGQSASARWMPLDIWGSGPASAFEPGTILRLVSEPFRVVVDPFLQIFSIDLGMKAWIRAIVTALWAIVVWGILGGAISRIAAVQQATGARIGIATALRFALRRGVALIGAPLCPMIGVGLFAAVCALIGLLYSIPGDVGAAIAGVLAFLPLLSGLVMTLMLVGLAVGWPLMIATVAVEGEDAFDSLSRSYSYVFQRPGALALYGAVSLVLGVVSIAIVSVFVGLIVHMAQWGLDFGGPSGRIEALYAGRGATGADLATSVHGLWLFLVRLLAHGSVYSFFFTASTMIYLLLRQDVDGASHEDIGGLSPEVELFAPEPEAPSSTRA